MRIDLVITELDTGGAEKCCTDLALFLARQGHRVRVNALGPPPPSSKDTLLRMLEAEKIETHFLGGDRWWKFPNVAAQLKRLMRIDQPDVVQAFLWHANVLSAWVVPPFRIRLFLGIRVSEPRKSRFVLDRWATSRSNKTICVSQGVADWCTKTERMDPRKILVIPNGIATDGVATSIDRDSHQVPDGARILLFVGRLEFQKGIDILSQYGEELLSRLPDHHLVVIGDGSMRPHLETLAHRPSLIGRVHCLGQRRDVQAWMVRSELLLLPTRYEGMPNVVLEAMSVGLPVVATRAEGVAELLGEQASSQSVPKDAWKELFDRVVALGRSSEERTVAGQANRERVSSEFALNKQLSKYESLYLSCVDDFGKPMHK
ncbi:MAG: glycosyltransferase [Planctomycetota bacterium]|nr:glycosyltransferase [Planctomycetota bacterium]